MHKKCSNCFLFKSVIEFYQRHKNKKPHTPNDYQSRCKSCNNEVVKGYVQRKKELKQCRK